MGGDRGVSLAERIASQFRLLAWKSPLHRMRLRGRFPLKLITVPTDPISGDGAVGAAMMKGVRPSRRDGADPVAELRQCRGVGRDAGLVDRKSTRLNSSH